MIYEQFVKLYEAGKYAEAIPLAEKYVEMTRRQFGENHTEYAIALNNLAEVYRVQNRFSDADILFKRALLIEEKILGSQHPNIAIRLFNMARLYDDQGQYDKIEILLKRALTIWESRPERHPHYIASTLTKLADAYCKLERAEEASPLYEQALVVTESVFGREHPEVAVHLNVMADHYIAEKELSRAGTLLVRAMEIDTKIYGPFHPNVAYALSNLAVIHRGNRDFEAVERVLLEALEIYRKSLGDEHPKVAEVCDALGQLYLEQERYLEAEPQVRRALDIHKLLQGRTHVTTALSMNRLGEILLHLERDEDAEVYFKTALEILGKALGLKHEEVGGVFHNLARLYSKQGKGEEAEKLFKCALEIQTSLAEKDQQDDVRTAQILQSLAFISKHQKRYEEAETSLKKALLLLEKKLGAADPELAKGLISLGQLYVLQEKYEAAIPFYKMALKSQEKNYGSDNNSVAQTLKELAFLHDTQKQHDISAPLYKCAAEIQEKLFGQNWPVIAELYINLGEAYLKQKKVQEACAAFKKANSLFEAELKMTGHIGFLQRRSALDRVEAGAASEVSEGLEIRNSPRKAGSSSFVKQALSAYLVSQRGDENVHELKNAGFIAAQYAHNLQICSSHDQMIEHFKDEEGDLATLLKERSHFVSEFSTLQNELFELLSKPKPAHKTVEMEYALKEKTLRDGLKNIYDSLDDIHFTFSEDFEEIASLLGPKTFSIENVQQNLQSDEALIKFIFTETEGLVWLVTKESSEWVSLSIGEEQIKKDIELLHYGLDPLLWENEDHARRGREVLAASYTSKDYKAGKPLPFDLKVAHKLYRELFGDISKFIKDKHLLVIVPPVLTSLSLSILVQEAPTEALPQKYEDYRDVHWFGLAHAITLLPTVQNFQTLRSVLKIGETKKTLLSFVPSQGLESSFNPSAHLPSKNKLLSAVQYAKQLRQEKGKFEKLKGLLGGKSGPKDKLRQPSAQSETVAEVMAIAEILGAPESDLIFGSLATEKKVKEFSEDGKLKDYGIVYFAAQSLFSQESGRKPVPGLSLAPSVPISSEPPSEKKNTGSDKALTLHDIAHLRMNADWVIVAQVQKSPLPFGSLHDDLCLELARSFFHAGARALLMSHWPVTPEAKVKVIASLFESLKDNQRLGRSEALREAIRLLITDKSRPWNGHPVVWGGFSVIGEGAAY